MCLLDGECTCEEAKEEEEAELEATPYLKPSVLGCCDARSGRIKLGQNAIFLDYPEGRMAFQC